MKNIKLAYLYRDGGNYKCHGEVVFSNEENLDATSVELELKRSFMSDGMFIANQIRIPRAFSLPHLGLDGGRSLFPRVLLNGANGSKR